MRALLLIALCACVPKSPVVSWRSSGLGVTELILLRSNGDGSYTRASNGVPDKHERVSLSKDQMSELVDLLRSKHACQLAHDPAYTPPADAGQATLELTLPDQRCKVVLWDAEWRRGDARDIAETMNSMRPVRPQPPR